MRSIILLLGLWSCQPLYHGEGATALCDTVYIVPPLETPKNICGLPACQLEFDIKEIKYGEYSDALIQGWVDSLPIAIRDSLATGKLVVTKHIYLSDIILNYGEKVEKIRAYDHILEEMLYYAIGMRQGLPSVVFSTHFYSSEIENYGKRDLFIIKIGKISY